MRIMGKKIENRTVLIALLVILIILTAYYLYISLPTEKKFLSPEDVLRNKDQYLNGTEINVRGYYDSNAVAVVSTMSNVAGKAILDLNLSNLKNATDFLITGHKFDFTGTLQKVGGLSDAVELVVIKAEPV